MSKGSREALTNHPIAQEAAHKCLQAGGSAVDAVLAAYFAFAGATSWGLLAPVSILLAGSGSGIRAIDGRARQPGQGIERPIRYDNRESAPLIARASAPATVAAIGTAATMFGQETLSSLALNGARIARKLGARKRAELITRIGSAKSWMLQDRSFLHEIAERVPRFEGALLQPSDLAIGNTEVAPCEASHSLAGSQAALFPWHDPSAPAPLPTTPLPSTVELLAEGVELDTSSHFLGLSGSFRLLTLVTERGSLAALLLQQPEHTIALFDGEVDLPVLGQPVLKGVPRLRPGSPLPLSAPLAVLFDGPRPTSIVASLDADFKESELEKLLLPKGEEKLTERVGNTLIVRGSTEVGASALYF